MRREGTVRLTALAALLLVVGAGGGFAHYQFVHYTTSTAPFTAAPEKFDLDVLPARTLYYFVSPTGLEKTAEGDSFTAILSQIRLAAATWSEVGTSGLRLEFGGLAASDTAQATPGIDVIFSELPPGVLAMGGPTARSAIVTRDSGPFVPITRSLLVLPNDLSGRPSHADAFFLTVLHELGHALGLQHTSTSSAMSTQTTRSTTKARPLAADDVAGISLLYPAPDFALKTGSIAGRVTVDGQGVHLASVVALDPGGTAVSALTDPDGYYKITGLPPGQYYLAVHPLPPGAQPELGPADIVLPVDPDGKPVPAGALFESAFYPGAKAFQEAAVLYVRAGGALENRDFAVQPRASLAIHGVTTYSFPGNYAVKPAFLNINGSRNFLVASGVGLITDDAPSAGLGIVPVGGGVAAVDGGVKAYWPAPSFLELDFSFNPFAGAGPRHLVFSLNNDIYVLPAALHLVRSQPPSVASVTPGFDAQGNRIAVLAGSNLVPSTRVLFDGQAASVVSFDDSSGSLVVAPPPGASGHQAVVAALDLDGQTSMFLDAARPPVYAYDPAEAPYVALLSPAALPAGAEAMIEIEGINTNFIEGQTVLGFGSSDVVVRKSWVRDATHLIANVHVAGPAQQTMLPLTVITGFQVATEANALQIQPASQTAPVPNPELINPLTAQPSIFAGGQAVLSVLNLPPGLPPEAVRITISDVPVTVTSIQEGRILFEVPAGLPLGPEVLRLNLETDAALPVVVVIDPAPPVIKAVSVFGTYAVGPDLPAVHYQRVTLTVSGLADARALANPRLVRIDLGGVVINASQVVPDEADPATCFVKFYVSPDVPVGDAVPLRVMVGPRYSSPVAVPIRASYWD